MQFLDLRLLALYLLLLPRLAVVYPLYALATLLLSMDYKRPKKVWLLVLSVTVFSFISITLLSILYKVSWTAYFLELVLILPMLLLCCKPYGGWESSLTLTKQLNIWVLVLSVINMVVAYGFPFRLPYIDFLPDAYSALWGSGGAKITTFCGFMGMVVFWENKKSLIFCISLFNFVIPNYNIGIACGVVALLISVVLRMNRRDLTIGVVGVMLMFFFVYPYVETRIEQINLLFLEVYGVHPKLYGYWIVLKMFMGDPVTILTGAGLGNFSGSGALWASEYISMISNHKRLGLPGLHESYLHMKYLGPSLSLAEMDRWSISSSFNKPYSTITTLMAELGVFMGSVLLLFFFRVFKNDHFQPDKALMLGLFVGAIFVLDNLHSNPLFWGVLLVGLRGCLKQRHVTAL